MTAPVIQPMSFTRTNIERGLAALLDQVCPDLDASDVVRRAGLNRGARGGGIQLLQQLRGCLQIASFEAFGESIVSGCEQRSCLCVLTVPGAQSSQVQARPQLPRYGRLATRDSRRSDQQALRTS